MGMAMRLEAFKATVAMMRAHGVRRFRQGDTEIELVPDESLQPSPQDQQNQQKEVEALMSAGQMPSDDDLLYWSTGEELPSEASKADENTVSVAAPPGVTVRKG